MLDFLNEFVQDHRGWFNFGMLVVMVLVMVLVLHGYNEQDKDMVLAGGWILLLPSVLFLLLWVHNLTGKTSMANIREFRTLAADRIRPTYYY